MRSYSWWLSQKPRVRKKYTLCCGMYLSPKEVKKYFKNRKKALQYFERSEKTRKKVIQNEID